MKKYTWLIDLLNEKKFSDGGTLITYNQVWVSGNEIDISKVTNRNIIVVDGNQIMFSGTIHYIKEVGSDLGNGALLYKLSL